MSFPIDTTTIAFIILLVAILILIGFIFHLNNKLKKFLIGKSSGNIDESIDSVKTSITELERFRSELEKYLVTVEKRLKKSVQAVHTVRFNPFKGTGSGGNQSFATAFLNEENDGVVISSIYSREHTSVFSKPVKGASSEYELSGEEKEAIQSAKNIVKQ